MRNNRWVGDVTAQKGWSAFNRIGPAAEGFEDHQVLDTFCDEAERFITQSVVAPAGGQPFFLYFALTAPHTPLCPSAEFEGKSHIGVYGDFVIETDHRVGRILTALEQNGVDNNTLVFATSDHGAAPYAGRNRKATDGHETVWKKAIAAHGKKLRRRTELLQPEFVQLFNLANDPSESINLAAQQVDRVRELHDLFIEQVNRGRSTLGPAITNDRGTIRAFPSVSSSVWENSPASM